MVFFPAGMALMRKIIGLTLLLFAAASAKAETDTRAKCSDNARQLLEQAWAEQPMDRSPNNTGNPAKAEYLYKQALLDSPQCKLAMSQMASLLLRDDKFRQAKEYNDLLLKYYPDDPDALQQKASLLSGAINDQQGALKIYLHLLEMNGPGNGSLYYAVAKVYSKLNQLDQSIKFLTLAISINKAWGSGGNAQVDKDFENLRRDPRFWALVKQP
jgi:tetratricopeptide (TPR) repeat protein